MKHFILILAVFLSGCMTTQYVSNYKVEMSNIEIDGKRFPDSVKMVYKDSLIDIVWIPDEKMFMFELANVSSSSFQVVWDQAAIVTETGESKRVFHTGIKYIDAEKSQPPTTVIKGSKIIDGLTPSDGVKFVPGDQYKPAKWVTKNIYFAGSGKDRAAVESEAQKYIGKSIQVLLPIKQGDKTTEYVFNFILKDIDIKEERVPNNLATGILSAVAGAALGILLALSLI